ncbi:hypothetical protein [Brachyspira alvinipulli]|uniref:hypothetical protein n=1 Tax=Brachyspira alvinipulli TaxID=84379 RepID=UPI000489B64F|nr:hypothetical protein [Brachyspira alvinipulli]
MIKTLDETISYYNKKYNLLKNYDPLRAEEYKQLYEWLEDYKELIKNKNNRFQMIKEAMKSKEKTNCQ